MKKHIYTLALLLVCVLSYAQFTYGPKVGTNISWVKVVAGETQKKVIGFQAGAFLNAEIYDRIGFQLDFLIASKGHKNEATGLDSIITETKTKYRLWEIPVCLYFPISKHIRGFVGPQVNVYRAGLQTVSRKGKEVETDIAGDNGQSWIFGFDLNLDSPLTFGIRYTTNKFTANEDVELNSVMINIGYTMDW